MWGFWESSSTKQRKQAEAEAARVARESRVVKHNTENFNKGGLGVLITGTAAIAACVFCRRSVIARRYVPKQFNSNILPPKFNPMKDAARAVVDATALAASMFGFTVASIFWIYDAGNLKELGQTLTATYSPERQPVSDPEAERIERELSSMLFSRQEKK